MTNKITNLLLSGVPLELASYHSYQLHALPTPYGALQLSDRREDAAALSNLETLTNLNKRVK